MKIIMQTILATGIAAALGVSSPARAVTFIANDFVTYGQGDWPTDSVAVQLLLNDFDTVYPSGALVVGIGNSITFDSPGALGVYLPSNGPAAPLTTSYDDPHTTGSGLYGGDATALALNVNYSDKGLLPGTSSVPFGDLLLKGFDPKSEFFDLNGMSVSAFLVLNETALGGGSITYNLNDLDGLLQQVNGSFALGIVTDFAAAHLEFPNTDVGATPLPGALPLFATGLGALGLLGWRRKRKAAVALAAA